MRTPGTELETYNGEQINRDFVLKQRVAFLSVVEHQSEVQRRLSSFSRLDSAVISTIFGFGALPVRRVVCLTPMQMDEDR